MLNAVPCDSRRALARRTAVIALTGLVLNESQRDEVIAAGAEEIDLVLLMMERRGAEKLLQDKVSLGAGVSVAAGPVGRTARASTDAHFAAEILSYSPNVAGGVLGPDADANRDVYGPSFDGGGDQIAELRGRIHNVARRAHRWLTICCSRAFCLASSRWRMNMRRSLVVSCAAMGGLALALSASHPSAQGGGDRDFGLFIADQLRAHAEQLFGFTHPLAESAIGPYNGADNTQAIQVAPGLTVSLISSSVASAGDQIAMWPDDDHPTHLFVCDEETSNPAVQRVDLSLPPGSNATTIVTGLSSCDPVRRTPWGTIIVAEEAGASGGLYELLDPVHITQPINVSNRAAGTTSDANHLVKRKAVGSLSFESFAIAEDGTMIYGDELAPSNGNSGGSLYKFVPAIPFTGVGPILTLNASPLAAGTVYGLRVAGANGSSNWGQGAEVGKGQWVEIDTTGAGVLDANGNIILRTAQLLQKFTGFYRPEDMDLDPIALQKGQFRACWANTGRLDFGGGSLVEHSGVNGEVLCLVDEPATANPLPPTGTVPVVTRFVVGSQQAGMFDNVAFQPHTGNLVVLEDGPTSIVTKTGTQPRGNDLWICLPDGDDDDTLSDGCVRFASVRDTTAEPSGFIFTGSGRSAFVNIQHRAVNDAAGAGNHGALLMISGFKADKGADDDR